MTTNMISFIADDLATGRDSYSSFYLSVKFPNAKRITLDCEISKLKKFIRDAAKYNEDVIFLASGIGKRNNPKEDLKFLKDEMGSIIVLIYRDSISQRLGNDVGKSDIYLNFDGVYDLSRNLFSIFDNYQKGINLTEFMYKPDPKVLLSAEDKFMISYSEGYFTKLAREAQILEMFANFNNYLRNSTSERTTSLKNFIDHNINGILKISNSDLNLHIRRNLLFENGFSLSHGEHPTLLFADKPLSSYFDEQFSSNRIGKSPRKSINPRRKNDCQVYKPIMSIETSGPIISEESAELQYKIPQVPQIPQIPQISQVPYIIPTSDLLFQTESRKLENKAPQAKTYRKIAPKIPYYPTYQRHATESGEISSKILHSPDINFASINFYKIFDAMDKRHADLDNDVYWCGNFEEKMIGRERNYQQCVTKSEEEKIRFLFNVEISLLNMKKKKLF